MAARRTNVNDPFEDHLAMTFLRKEGQKRNPTFLIGKFALRDALRRVNATAGISLLLDDTAGSSVRGIDD